LKHTSLVAAAAALGPGRAWPQQPAYVVADTAFGKIRGADVEGIKTFKGVPYGATTAGANRFKPPTDPRAWAGVRDALVWGPSAPQREPGREPSASALSVAAADLPPDGEDCLVLNVWTPALDSAKRPVML
jgi:para-nitrobenzyl esterase